MHDKPVSDLDGEFGPKTPTDCTCPECKSGPVLCQEWFSDCGGFVDARYECQNSACGHYWWVDGPDS